jgi:hypothetical protein
MSNVVSPPPTLIGVFDVRQKRERFLIKAKYTHRVVVFDTALVMVQLAPMHDRIAAGVKYASLPLHLVPHAKAVEHLVSALLRFSPEQGIVDAKWAQLPDFTPERLAAAFPHHVRGLENDQITSAVLKRLPPAELEVRYNSRRERRELQLWLSFPRSRSLDAVSQVMSRALGARFREAGGGEAIRRTARNLIPGRGLVVTTD